MNWRQGSLILLAVAALLLSACGPMPGETTVPDATVAPADTPASSEAAAPTDAPAEAPSAASDVDIRTLVDPDDWHVLGAPDAPVHMIEYSDFQ
ncbi:MAG: hypothetical protein PVG11_09100 [Anaerolineae bacterium]|jgi:hypothetical protein